MQVDADGEGSLDMSEFTFFIRKELKQTEADISSSDLKAFYQFLDEDGGGLEVEEVQRERSAKIELKIKKTCFEN